MYDTKFGIVVRDDLQAWQELNVTAFLAAGVSATAAECIGEPYEDGSGTGYLPLLVQPVLVYAASAGQLRRTRDRALSREVPLALYTYDMFATSNDADNRAAVKAVAGDELDIVGLGFRAERRVFDKIVNGLKLHP